jgi:hypothetical protein
MAVLAYMVNDLYWGHLEENPTELVLNAEISCKYLSEFRDDVMKQQGGPWGYSTKGLSQKDYRPSSSLKHISSSRLLN